MCVQIPFHLFISHCSSQVRFWRAWKVFDGLITVLHTAAAVSNLQLTGCSIAVENGNVERMRPLLIILTKIMPINYYYLIYVYIAQISSDQASIASTEGLDPCTVCSSLEWLEPLHPPRYKANALTNCPPPCPTSYQ